MSDRLLVSGIAELSDAMGNLSHWLASTAISGAMSSIPWAIPLVQSIHILAISLVIASSAMLDLRLMQIIDHPLSIEQMARRFLPWIWGGLVVLLLTGMLLIVAEPKRELLNYVFWTKMSLIFLIAAPLTMVLQLTLRRDFEFWSLTVVRRSAARVMAAVLLLAWVGIVFAGRWIAYVAAATE